MITSLTGINRRSSYHGLCITIGEITAHVNHFQSTLKWIMNFILIFMLRYHE